MQQMAQVSRRGRVRSLPQSPGLKKAAKAVGGHGRLAVKLKLSAQAVSAWKQIPIARVIDVERITKVPREELRPDIFKRGR